MPVIQLLVHATVGGLSVLAALWVTVELLNVREGNTERIKLAATSTFVLIWAAYLIGGWFYVFHYGADKAIIKAGHWPWAHNYFTEVKEHLFFILPLLATYLLIVIKRNNVLANKNARKLSMAVSSMIAIIALAMEGFGSIIAMGVKQGLLK